MLHLNKGALTALTMASLMAFAAAQDKPKNGEKKDGPKPYDEVITEEAESSKGLFRVHRLGDEVFFEIPPTALDVDMLWVTQLAKTQSGKGYGGTSLGNRIVRWERRDDQVLLRQVDYEIRAESGDTVRAAVEASSLEPILAAFPVKAWGRDQAAVIEVGDYFKGDPSEFSAKRRLDATGVDEKRSFIEEVKTFPTNVETKVLLTYKVKPDDNRGQGAVSVQLHHSMVLLPTDPMQPRLRDERVGFFGLSFEDYASDEHAVDEVSYIARWRLEKKDPNAELSEPVKPIVYYVGRGVPERWRPWVKKGVESWQPAFEAAGFKNAIVAEYAPSVQEDPDWDAEDARYSVIRWLPSTVQNAMGPHVHDPRTGEILEADILMYHNVLKLARDWYFVQASPNDERAQKLPMPDDLVGELLAYVVAHEVGHTLGFPHNMKASSSYTVENLRDPEFTAKYGTEASIMDYGRFNYVAQPGDGARLIPIIGPYDVFATEWGYRQFPGLDEHAERAELAKLTARQKTDPMLRFGNPNPAEDPSQQTEDLGSDPIAATALGLKNLDRVMGYLVEATCEEGEDYSLLRNMYDQVLSQRGRELGHVANVVGGFVQANLFYGDADVRFEPVSAERQRAAVAFLHEHAFETPRSLIRDDILLRLETSGVADSVLSHQQRLLRTLLSSARIKRMAEHADRRAGEHYAPVDLVRDLTEGIFRELGASPVEIDLHRRYLQRALVDQLRSSVDDEDATHDLPALARGELHMLLGRIQSALRRADDMTTARHLEQLAAEIQGALDPTKKDAEPTTASASAVPLPRRN